MANKLPHMKIRKIVHGLLVIASLAALAVVAKAQTLLDSGDSSGPVASTTPVQLSITYTPPTQATKIHNCLFDAFGPYPMVGAALTAGFGQATNIGPKWGHGLTARGRNGSFRGGE